MGKTTQIIRVKIGKESNKILLFQDNKKFFTIRGVNIGKNGAVEPSEKREGDQKTPLGVYKIGPAFGNGTKRPVNFPYIPVTDNSYFVDDQESEFYNKWVEIGDHAPIEGYSYITSSQEKTFKSAEHLKDFKKQYDKAFIIEFNTTEPKIGGGSAIFFHVKGTSGYTGGCVAIEDNEMEFIYRWLDKKQNPYIVIEREDSNEVDS